MSFLEEVKQTYHDSKQSIEDALISDVKERILEQAKMGNNHASVRMARDAIFGRVKDSHIIALMSWLEEEGFDLSGNTKITNKNRYERMIGNFRIPGDYRPSYITDDVFHLHIRWAVVSYG